MARSLLKDFRIGSDVIDAVVESLAVTEILPGETEAAPLRSVALLYSRNLEANALAKEYLEERGLDDWRILSRLGCGYSDGTLPAMLSPSQRALLITCGALDAQGQETLAGSVVFPLKDERGEVVGFYGRRISASEGAEDIYLAGEGTGLINREALSLWREEIIVTESVLEAVRLLVLGIERVLPLYGEDGFTDEHLRALKDAHVKKVVLSCASAPLAQRLKAEGFAVATLSGESATALSREEYEVLVGEAPVSGGEGPARWDWNESAQRWELYKGDLVYKATGSTRRLGTSLRLSVRVEREGVRFLDHVDLYSARSRLSFREQSASRLAVEGALVEQDLLALLDQLESDAEEGAQRKAERTPLSAEETELGLSLLRSPSLFEDIIGDMEAIGHVGEEENKLLVYLAASSRKLTSPVSVVVASASAAGKSFMIDTVRRLMPADEVVNLTSLSDQALNYMGEGTLLHKLLILGEAVHNEVVEHQIREMLSSRCLSRMVVTKDEKTGKLSSTLVKQDAIVSLMMSTTRSSMNAENASRYLLVHADESDEQTQRIHEKQNRAYSFEAMRSAAEAVPRIIRKHHAAQRLLERITIVNPYASDTEFPYRLMRSRRDNKQLQDLVVAVCFLRQYQKKKKEQDGIVYIECDPTDVEIAWRLFRTAVMKASFLELPESLVRLYEDIRALCRASADVTGISSLEVKFDQGQLRRRIHYLGAESVKKYLRLLVSLEYISLSGSSLRGQRARYQLIADESLESMAGFDEITKSG